MKEMALTYNAILIGESSESKHDRAYRFWTAALLTATMLSILAGLGGLVFSTASWFLDENIENFTGVGTGLLMTFFPLLFVVGHSLDKIREAEKAIRLERCRQTGLKDTDC